MALGEAAGDGADGMVALMAALQQARRTRDSELWCFQSAAAVFAGKPFERNHIDLLACAERLKATTVQVDKAQEAIDTEHARVEKMMAQSKETTP